VGFRVEFASAAETHGRVTPFFVPAALGRSDFLDEEKRPLEYTPFKAMVESLVDADGVRGRVYAELSEYLTHMAQPTHLNFDRSVLQALLPTAMSFTFLSSFNDFCRRFILPADKLDITDVAASYRAFQRYERDLGELNDQLERLLKISDLFVRHSDLLRDARLARYLGAEISYQHAIDLRREADQKVQALQTETAVEQMRAEELEVLIPGRRAQMDGIQNAIREAPDGPLYLELKSRNQELAAKIGRFGELGRTLESALAYRVNASRAWLRELESVSVPLTPALVEALSRGVTVLEGGGVHEFAKNFRALGELAKPVAEEVSRLARPTLQRLLDIRHQQAQLRDQIAALKIGRMPFPTLLLDTLNTDLPTIGPDLPAHHLRDLCELRDGEESWRPAIEVAFTRKFAVVVSPEHYDMAERIYHELREETPGESLVNPRKALKLRKPIRPNSLAEKIAVMHPVAEAIVSHLFGEVICVERREQLRDHDAAITPDGFMARRAFVERPRHYDNLPVVGRRGLQQQLIWKQNQRAQIETEERQLRPDGEALEAVQQQWSVLFASLDSLYEDLHRSNDLTKLQTELDANLERLDHIGRAKFDELALTHTALEVELRKLGIEQRDLDRSAKRNDLKHLVDIASGRLTEEQQAQDHFDSVRAEADVSVWLPRLAELRQEVCTQLILKDAAARRFDSLYNENKTAAAVRWVELLGIRRELARVYTKFDDLPAEASDNNKYDNQLAKLNDSEIPDYKGKAERERRTWEKLFRTQVLEKLRYALVEVENTRQMLNVILKRRIGNNRYRILKCENPDFTVYHKMLDASALAHEGELFFASADADLREACDHFLQILIDEDKKAEATRLLDYRHYFQYDMEVEDLGNDGELLSTARVDRQSRKFSGGENQSPYFIAILASYLRAYKRHDTRKGHPSLALVPIDEAFSKLSGDCIKDCIEALKALDLQGVFSMSTGNIPYAFEHCDSLVVVAKEQKRIGKRLHVRNVPVSLHRDSPEARELLGLDA
jgi:hypothetical protein